MEDYQALTDAISQRRTDLGQRYAALPQMESDLRSQMFGNDAVTQNLQAQEKAKIDELFRHDQEVATQYSQQPELSTSPSGRVLDPYSRELALSNRYRGTAGDLTTIRQQQQTRRDIIGDSLTNALKLAAQSLEMKKLELENLSAERDFSYKVLQDRLDREERAKKEGAGNQAIQALFDSILGYKQAGESMTNTGEQVLNNFGLTMGKLRSAITEKASTIPSDIAGQLAAAAIAGKGSSSDVASIMQYLGQGSNNYLSPTKRSIDLQSRINEAQAIINDMRKFYKPVDEVQQAISDLTTKDPELKGYIK